VQVAWQHGVFLRVPITGAPGKIIQDAGSARKGGDNRVRAVRRADRGFHIVGYAGARMGGY
jgi:hypothetical protein